MALFLLLFYKFKIIGRCRYNFVLLLNLKYNLFDLRCVWRAVFDFGGADSKVKVV